MGLIPVNPPGPTFPAFSQAVQAGSWLVLSGQIGLKDGKLVSEDPLAQAEQCFDNLEEVLAAAGASFADVVKLTCFLTDASAYSAYAQVKRERLGESAPAGTALIISELLIPKAVMEVEAIAWIGGDADSAAMPPL